MVMAVKAAVMALSGFWNSIDRGERIRYLARELGILEFVRGENSFGFIVLGVKLTDGWLCSK